MAWNDPWKIWLAIGVACIVLSTVLIGVKLGARYRQRNMNKPPSTTGGQTNKVSGEPQLVQLSRSDMRNIYSQNNKAKLDKIKKLEKKQVKLQRKMNGQEGISNRDNYNKYREIQSQIEKLRNG